MLALEPDFLVASQPLFERGEVGALSLSVDFLWMRGELPDWTHGLVAEYGEAGALHGHAIYYSTLSALPSAENLLWLADYRRSVIGRRVRLRMLSAHFGVSVVPGYARGAPLPVPRSSESVHAGRHWMSAIADEAGCSIGLENLALAFSREDCIEQGRFLAELLDFSPRGDGFVALDVHNVFCQAQNFELDPYALLASYPLDRVRELHVSGGSFGRSSAEPGRVVRQDTHDGDVPPEVFELASWVVARAPSLDAVFFERLGGTLGLGPGRAAARFRDDYARLVDCVNAGVRARAAAPAALAGAAAGVLRPSGDGPIVDTGTDLADYEALLVRTLAEGRAPADTRAQLLATSPAAYRGRLAQAELRMLDLGGRVVREWFEGAAS